MPCKYFDWILYALYVLLNFVHDKNNNVNSFSPDISETHCTSWTSGEWPFGAGPTEGLWPPLLWPAHSRYSTVGYQLRLSPTGDSMVRGHCSSASFTTDSFFSRIALHVRFRTKNPFGDLKR